MSETQIAALFDPPAEPRELVRYYTLTETDLAMVRRCRGDHSRLGYALMLCYLRHPGRPLRTNERPSAALVSFVAEQIDVRPEAIGDYLASEQNRRRHAAELQDRLRLGPFGKRAAAELANDLHSQALENDRLFHLAELVMEECRKRRVVVPAPRRLEHLCIDLRFRARREIEHRLTLGLSHEQRRQLDALTQRRAETGQSWLVWLRQMPLATKPAAMLGLIERLNHVRAIG
ncbi:MAG: DUF4158 domain-containing protein, partial [Stellaceae bacterium]